jgi:teichuronic acid exporter
MKNGINLKEKTISGVFWNFVDYSSNFGVNFIIGIILARILSPAEFGLIGMIGIFIAISMTFINGGFSNALIRKKECTEIDFSTVFYFNFLIAFLIYGVLYFCAPYIANYFNERILINIVRVLSIVIVISSLSIIQKTTLTKKIDFKLQTQISLTSNIFSGVIGICLAYNGWGVWSLVYRTLIQQSVKSIMLWTLNKWRPLFIFSIKSFKELFSFGSKLLFSSLIDTLYKNIYFFIIGKYFSAEQLGYYTRANNFKELPSSHINSIISSVSYPVLSQLQDDKPKLKSGYKYIIKSTMFITFVLMLSMSAMSEPLIVTLIGEKWRESIVYLQLLCFVGMLYPLHALNLNMLNVQGRSDLFLRLEVIKKIIAIPTIVIGIYFGIKVMIIMMFVNSVFAFYLNSYWSGKFINYSMKEQIYDILPSLIIALINAAILFMISLWLTLPYWIILCIQLILGLVLVVSMSELFKLDAYFELKKILVTKLEILKNGKKN